MQLVPVVSSNVAAIGFEDGLLEVLFKNGRLYRAHAPESLFKEFLAAASKGRFYHQRVKPLNPIRIQ